MIVEDFVLIFIELIFYKIYFYKFCFNFLDKIYIVLILFFKFIRVKVIYLFKDMKEGNLVVIIDFRFGRNEEFIWVVLVIVIFFEIKFRVVFKFI